MRHAPTLILLTLALNPSSGYGQDTGAVTPASARGELVDRVVAVVGDSVVMHTQVQEELLRMQAQGMAVPARNSPERAEWERNALNDLVSQLLLLQAAAGDSLVTVEEGRIETTLAQTWDQQVETFGTEARLREALESEGRTLLQYRAQLRDEIRRSLLIQRYLQLRVGEARTLPVEESDIRAFFERERERLGERPATLTFRQVFVMPSPSDEAMEEAASEAERIRALLDEGEDFADLARRYSADPGSQQLGGDLGWFRLGSGLVKEFEDAAFSLRPGVVSPVVRTMYGAHLIKVERVRGAERKIHHILIAAAVTPEDAVQARTRAEEILGQVRAGAPISNFTEAQRQMDLPDSVSIERTRLDQYPTAFAAALQSASPGEIIGPVAFPTQQGDAQVVIQVLDVRSAGEYTYEDVRDLIQTNLRNERTQERILADLRARTYVEIRL